MVDLGNRLELARCPYCGLDRPLLLVQWQSHSTDYSGANARYWRVYKCQRCGGMVLASAHGFDFPVLEQFPATLTVSPSVPDPTRSLLLQAIDSFHAPAGSVLLVESAVDAMLREYGYREGSVGLRLDRATKERLLPEEMLQWAHQLHLWCDCPSGKRKPLPTLDDAKQAVEFGLAMAEFLFVLPARIQRGVRDTAPEEQPNERSDP